MGRHVYALKEIGYNGEQKERGEVFELQGLRNDEMLLKHRYLVLIKLSRNSPLNSLPSCDGCAKVFAEDVFKTQHDEGRIHPRSPNYEGEEARFGGEKPTPLVKEILAGRNKAPIYE